jgi:Malectin domain/Bacterial protein of unknown function (DUF839)
MINAGYESSTFFVNDADAWYPDQFYLGGTAVETSDCVYSSQFERVSCSYRLFRGGNSTPGLYDIPILESGMYNVTLYFLEPYFNTSGRRLFDIYIQGAMVLPLFDIFETAGAMSTLCSKSFPVAVNSSLLTIDFEKVKSFPLISGIEVRSISGNTEKITDSTSLNSTATAVNVTYEPGNLLTNRSIGLRLSVGLAVKVIVKSGRPVQYLDGTNSTDTFHRNPDAAATFPDVDPLNQGGWIYVSNSEVYKEKNEKKVMNKGGVGAIKFDKYGNVINYTRLLNGTTANCGGGRTPWGSWISCEEHDNGEIYQVDPMGKRSSEKIFMGSVNKGQFESFAFDIRNMSVPHFFVTKDDEFGEITRL